MQFSYVEGYTMNYVIFFPIFKALCRGRKSEPPKNIQEVAVVVKGQRWRLHEFFKSRPNHGLICVGCCYIVIYLVYIRTYYYTLCFSRIKPRTLATLSKMWTKRPWPCPSYIFIHFTLLAVCWAQSTDYPT